MKKVLISDYDHTFYLDDEDIEKNIIAVSKFRNNGNIFVIATGRSFFDLNNKVTKYNISYDYAILNHGTTIIDKDNNIVENNPIQNEILSTIKNDLFLEKSTSHFCCSELDSRVEFDHKDLTKIHISYENTQIAIEINKIINIKYSEFVKSYLVSDEKAIEIVSNTNKSKAINFLNKILKIDKENIFTIGDSYNDIEMIKNFNGYCMQNSVPELVDYCKEKTVKSVSELLKTISEEAL